MVLREDMSLNECIAKLCQYTNSVLKGEKDLPVASKLREDIEKMTNGYIKERVVIHDANDLKTLKNIITQSFDFSLENELCTEFTESEGFDEYCAKLVALINDGKTKTGLKSENYANLGRKLVMDKLCYMSDKGFINCNAGIYSVTKQGAEALANYAFKNFGGVDQAKQMLLRSSSGMSNDAKLSNYGFINNNNELTYLGNLLLDVKENK